MSKIGPKELALKAQRESKRPRGHVRLDPKHMVADFPKAIRESGEDAGVFKTKVGKPSLKAVQQAKAKMAVMKAPSPQDELTAAFGALTMPDDGSVPEFLKRTETEEQAMNRRNKNVKPDKSAGVTLAPPLSVQKAIAKDLADDDDSDPMLKALPSGARAASVDAANKKKAKKLPKPDPMERKLAEAVAEAKAPAEAQPMEATVKTKSKSKAKATNGSGKKTKVQIIAELLQRKQGCTTEEVLKATGWPAVSMPQQAKAAGLKLKKEKDGNVTRYRAG